MTDTTPPPPSANIVREQVRAIISNISIGATGFLWNGQPMFSGSAGGDPISVLSQQIYAIAFMRNISDISPKAAPIVGDLTAALSQANSSVNRWDAAWNITQTLPHGTVQVKKGEWTRFAQPGEFLTHDGPGVPPRIGMSTSLWAPRESIAYQNGFYFAFGQTLLDSEIDSLDQIRFYFNIRATGTPALLNLCSQQLNRFAIPFRMKCLSRLELFDRLDAAVLYTHRRFTRIVAELMIEVARNLGQYFGSDTPLFTATLVPGLAYAQDPTTASTPVGARPGESFGTHRCRLLAEAIISSMQNTRAARLQDIEQYFLVQGISLDRPHYHADSVDPLDGFLAQ
jgi:HopA1 effector protein family